MGLVRRVFFRCLPLAGLATAMCLLVYLAVQQMWRHSANDPQVQMAYDIAGLVAGGQTPDTLVPASLVDLAVSLDPFVTVFNDAGAIIASSGRLHGQLRTLPAGVIDHVRQTGEERVTWQPEPGVRIATVIVRSAGSPGEFVLVGRSLRESEARTAQFRQIVQEAWVAVLVALVVLVAVSEYGLSGTARPR